MQLGHECTTTLAVAVVASISFSAASGYIKELVWHGCEEGMREQFHQWLQRVGYTNLPPAYLTNHSSNDPYKIPPGGIYFPIFGASHGIFCASGETKTGK